jgi:hypothetical protein
MDFNVACSCGQILTVNEAAAEGTRNCPCGRMVAIPSLREMRLKAGLPAFNISPEIMIEHLLLDGQLPGTKTCVVCGKETDHLIQILIECERRWTKTSSGFSWGTLFLSMLFLPVLLFRWRAIEGQSYGRDKVYSLPLAACSECKSAIRNRKAILQALDKIPEYSRLIEKFPDATVTVHRL